MRCARVALAPTSESPLRWLAPRRHRYRCSHERSPTAINVPSIPVADPSNASPSVASLGTIPSKALRFVNFDVLTIAVLSLFCLLAVSPRLGSSIQSFQLQSDHDSFPVRLLNDMFRVRLNFRSYCE